MQSSRSVGSIDTFFRPRDYSDRLLELFSDLLPSARANADGCAKPIGRRAAGRRRRAGPTVRRSPLAQQVAELRRHVDRRLDEVMGELQTLRQQRRNAFEMPEGILRRLVEIERCLKIIEPPRTPVLTRRHPVS
jgi:hypothetical protein